MFDWFWEFLYGLIKTVLYCIDFILNVAKMLCGIEPVYVDGIETDLLYYFLRDSTVTRAFILVALIAFILLFLFTIFSLIRSQAKFGEGKTPIQICLNSAKCLLYFLLIPAIMWIGSVFVSTIMTSINAATSDGSQTLAGTIFCVIADEAYDGNAADKAQVMENFRTGVSDYNSTSQVDSWFSLKKINYFLGFAGGIAVLVLLVISLMGFVERLISLVTLFILSPLSVSSCALDDGMRFKLWRDQVINKFLVAYGALISINIYAIVMQLVIRIEFFDNHFMNLLAQFLFILGGAFACRRGVALIGNLINHNAGTQELAEQSMARRGVAGVLLGGAAMVAGLGRKAASPAQFGINSVKDGARQEISERARAGMFGGNRSSGTSTGNRFSSSTRGAETRTADRGLADTIKRGGAGNGTAPPTAATSVSRISDTPPPLPPRDRVGNAAGGDRLNREATQTIKSALEGTKNRSDREGGNK